MTTRKSSDERRKEIADAALKIISERGLREFTAAQIAQVVGIKDASLFRHFTDMNAIALAALDRLQEAMITEANPGAPPLEQLERFVLGRLRSVAEQPGLQSLVFSDQLTHALGLEGARRIAALRNRGRELIRGYLCDAAAKGQLRDDLDIDSSVVLITGSVMGFLFATKDGGLTVSSAEMAPRIWQTVLRLIGKKDPVA